MAARHIQNDTGNLRSNSAERGGAGKFPLRLRPKPLTAIAAAGLVAAGLLSGGASNGLRDRGPSARPASTELCRPGRQSPPGRSER